MLVLLSLMSLMLKCCYCWCCWCLNAAEAITPKRSQFRRGGGLSLSLGSSWILRPSVWNIAEQGYWCWCCHCCCFCKVLKPTPCLGPLSPRGPLTAGAQPISQPGYGVSTLRWWWEGVRVKTKIWWWLQWHCCQRRLMVQYILRGSSEIQLESKY